MAKQFYSMSRSWAEPRTYSEPRSLRPWVRDSCHMSKSWRLERTDSRYRGWDESRSWTLGMDESQ